MKFPESALAHKYLDGLRGVEIGGSAHNAFGLNTRNVDYTANLGTVFKQSEIELCGEAMPVDIVAYGDDLPLPDESEDFVLSSHVLEHFYDTIGALLEWNRVIKPGGYMFAIVPKRDALPEDAARPLTTVTELAARFDQDRHPPDDHHHWSVLTHEQGCELVGYMNTRFALGWVICEVLETDDKVGNGWCIVIRKGVAPVARSDDWVLPVEDE